MPTQKPDLTKTAVIVNSDEETRKVAEYAKSIGVGVHHSFFCYKLCYPEPLYIASNNKLSWYKLDWTSSPKDSISFSDFIASISEKWVPKIGEVVICKNNANGNLNLTENKEYTVTHYTQDRVYVNNDHDENNWYTIDRFRPCPPPTQKEEREVVGYKHKASGLEFDISRNTNEDDAIYVVSKDSTKFAWIYPWQKADFQPIYAPTSITLFLGSGKREFSVSNSIAEVKQCGGKFAPISDYRWYVKMFNDPLVESIRTKEGEIYTRSDYNELKAAIESTENK